jgi:hypothetical protein
MEGVQENSVWTWNAIGKQKGAWGLDPGANEGTEGFLMNHLISELLPRADGRRDLTNSDPVTGQAAWYDLKVKITPAAPGETGVWPQFDIVKPLPGKHGLMEKLRYHTHAPVRLTRSICDIITRGLK